jgi:spore coat protein U-like protein
VTVQATCIVSLSLTRLRTGAALPERAMSNISVKCTNSVPYNVSLSRGLAPGPIVIAGSSGDTITVSVTY